jgi:hypothetical protein
MRFPEIDYVLREQRKIVDDAGGLQGVRDMHLLLSALGHPCNLLEARIYALM